MSITSIKEALKEILQTFQPATLIPAIIFVIMNMYYVIPKTGFINYSPDDETILTLTIFIIILVSYLLYAFNGPLIRLAEGYVSLPFNNFLIKKQIDDYNYLKSFATIDDNSAIQKLETYFPSKERAVLPTKLGNTIASFEHYSNTRYGIDAIALWPRLIPVLQDTKYIEFISHQKAVFDFMLNMMYTVFVVGLELSYLSIYLGQFFYFLPYLFITFLLTFVFYEGAVNGAVSWGICVKVAFDIFRWDLWNKLHLKPLSKEDGETVSVFSKEIERWTKVSKLIACNARTDFDEFYYDKSD